MFFDEIKSLYFVLSNYIYITDSKYSFFTRNLKRTFVTIGNKPFLLSYNIFFIRHILNIFSIAIVITFNILQVIIILLYDISNTGLYVLSEKKSNLVKRREIYEDCDSSTKKSDKFPISGYLRRKWNSHQRVHFTHHRI
jgi:hypothetical protein